MFNAPLISTDGQNSLIRQTQVKHAEDEMVRAFERGAGHSRSWPDRSHQRYSEDGGSSP